MFSKYVRYFVIISPLEKGVTLQSLKFHSPKDADVESYVMSQY